MATHIHLNKASLSSFRGEAASGETEKKFLSLVTRLAVAVSEPLFNHCSIKTEEKYCLWCEVLGIRVADAYDG